MGAMSTAGNAADIWWVGLAWTAAATVLAALAVRLLWLVQDKAVTRLRAWLVLLRRKQGDAAIVSTYVDHANSGVQWVVTALCWGLIVLVVDLWASFVLQQFSWTRAWGLRSFDWLMEVLGQFFSATLGAVPGLLTALLIFGLARLVSQAQCLLLERVERGEVRLGWLDKDTAGPTRRLAQVVVWLFALAMAYPYLPGSNSEAFKGLSVLAGLMLSLGASSVVGQAMSGLSLMYSRALRAGEYVKIGETEGTVTQLGLFATRVQTGMGEEVILPNSVVFGQPVRNFSRLVEDGQFVLHTAVTIGYATPWRQVHAMLLEAAARTPGVAGAPAPYVIQSALSDFYVEYRLCAQGNNHAPRRRAEALSALHANVQDVFNENGVQIMSPHYLADPPAPQVVPAGPWAPQRGEALRPPAQRGQPDASVGL